MRSAATASIEFTDADILVPLYAPASERRPWDSKMPAPNNTYIGQMKLLASEIAFLTLGCSSDHLNDAIVVYAGAAAGQHIPALASLFPETEFWLYDPAPFAIEATDQIHIVKGLFTDTVAREWGDHRDGPVVFISDVRTSGDTSEEHESEVAANMAMQARWIELITPRWWSLKFRIPFTVIEANEPYPYLGGRLIYQPFAKPLSMELRLIGNGTQATQGPRAVSYDSRALEETVFYHNTIRRKQQRYADVFTGENDSYDDPEFDNGYDCSYLLHCVKRYMEGPGRAYLKNPPPLSTEAGQHLALTLTKRLIQMTSQGRWTLASRKATSGRPPRFLPKRYLR